MNLKTCWYDAVGLRTSRRAYLSQRIEAQNEAQIKSLIDNV